MAIQFRPSQFAGHVSLFNYISKVSQHNTSGHHKSKISKGREGKLSSCCVTWGVGNAESQLPKLGMICCGNKWVNGVQYKSLAALPN